MRRKSNQSRFTRLERILIICWGDPRSRIPKYLILTGLAMLANPWWLPIVYSVAIKYLELSSEPFDATQTSMTWTGWILFGIGIALYLRRKPPLFFPEPHFAEVNVALFGTEDKQEIILAAPITKPRVLEFPVALQIGNPGDATLNDIEIYLRMPRMLCWGGENNAVLHCPDGSKITIEPVAGSDKRQSFVCKVASLHPSQTIVALLPLSLANETKGSATVPLNKGTNQSVSIEFDYSYMVDLTVHSEDQPPVSRSYNIQVINTKEHTIEEYLKLKNTTFRKKLNERLASMTLWQRLRFRLHIKQLIIYELNEDQIQPDDQHPIDRTIEDAKFHRYEGILSDYGYIVPAANVEPKQTPKT